jgi:hypothetical protein
LRVCAGVGFRDDNLPPSQLLMFFVQPQVQCDPADLARPPVTPLDIPWQRCLVVVDTSVAPQLSATWAFKYDAPSVTSMTLSLPTEGGVLTISGFNFGTDMPDVALVRGADVLPCIVLGVVSVSAAGVSTVRCTVGEGVGAGWTLRFVVAGQTAPPPASKFAFMPPMLTSMSVTTGSTEGGFNVTLVGSNVGVVALLLCDAVAPRPLSLSCGVLV